MRTLFLGTILAALSAAVPGAAAGDGLLRTTTPAPAAAGVAGSAAVSASQGPARGGAQDHLNRAAAAILALKSTRFTLKREGAPAFLDEKNGVTFTTADCIYGAPDRVSCSVKVALRNGTILQLTRVWVPEGTFQSNPLTRQFVKIPADANFNGVLLFVRTGIPDVLRGGVAKTTVAGTETLPGGPAVHLKGEVSGSRLSPLMGAALKADAQYPVDLWIHERTAAPMRLHVTEPDGNGWLIELSGADEPVSIPTPTVPPAPAARH